MIISEPTIRRLIRERLMARNVLSEAFELGDESDYTGPKDGYGNCIKRGRCRSWS